MNREEKRKPVQARKARKRKRYRLYETIRRCIFLAIVVYTIVLLSSGRAPELEPGKIRTALAPRIEQSEGIEEGDTRALRQTFGINPDGWKEWFYYSSPSLMDVSEVLVVHASGSDILDTLETAVQSHVKERAKAFEGYGTNQSDLLKHAILTRKGNYLLYAVSEEAGEWEEVFLSAFR